MKLLSSLLLLSAIGAACAAPLLVDYVLAPVPLKQSTTDKSKLVAIVPPNSTHIVVKFHTPIHAEVEKTSEFEANFEASIPDGEAPIVKLIKKGSLEKPVVVNIKDTKNGDSVKVMIKEEEEGGSEKQ